MVIHYFMNIVCNGENRKNTGSIVHPEKQENTLFLCFPIIMRKQASTDRWCLFYRLQNGYTFCGWWVTASEHSISPFFVFSGSQILSTPFLRTHISCAQNNTHNIRAQTNNHVHRRCYPLFDEYREIQWKQQKQCFHQDPLFVPWFHHFTDYTIIA